MTSFQSQAISPHWVTETQPRHWGRPLLILYFPIHSKIETKMPKPGQDLRARKENFTTDQERTVTGFSESRVGKHFITIAILNSLQALTN